MSKSVKKIAVKKINESEENLAKMMSIYDTSTSYYDHPSAYSMNGGNFTTRFTNIDWRNYKDIIKLVDMESWEFPDNIIMTRDKYETKKQHDDNEKAKKGKAHKNKVKKTVKTNPTRIVEQYSEPTDIWQLVSKVRYYDKDEYKMNQNGLSRKLSARDCTYIINQLDTSYFDDLRSTLDDTAIFTSLDESDHKDIMTHIVMKGKSFYLGITECPDIAVYLCDQFYPVFGWLENIAAARR